VPGISRFLLEGVVAYSNESKQRRLGVSEALLSEHGAVSAPVAEAMARGIRETAGADIGVAVTGIAGPTGGTLRKPVGLVYIAIVDAAGCESREFRLGVTRRQIRERAARQALRFLMLRLAHAT
jgi:nicotinamide-nucleotide amidase